jgi:hypothetical protein
MIELFFFYYILIPADPSNSYYIFIHNNPSGSHDPQGSLQQGTFQQGSDFSLPNLGLL